MCNKTSMERSKYRKVRVQRYINYGFILIPVYGHNTRTCELACPKLLVK